MALDYRLGLDIGTNSIGYWLYELASGRPVRSLEGGVRIFSDGRNPKDKSSFAVARRMARSARRRRDRYLRRRAKLLRALVELGFLPADETQRRALVPVDPYALRARALNEKLQPEEIGRLLFHLHQRRGFKSNRKTDRGDSERGVVREGVERLNSEMENAGARTLGEFLHMRHERGEWVRARKRPLPNDKGKLVEKFDIYPAREMVQHEFDAIWNEQSRRNPSLMSEAARKRLKDIIFFQRRLKPVKPGRCRFYPEEDRLPAADPVSQLRRLYQELNHLRIVTPGQGERSLNQAERDKLAELLRRYGKRSFAQLRREIGVKLPDRFNLESERRTDLLGDQTASVLAQDKYYGAGWHDLPLDRQREIVRHLLEDEDEPILIAWLMAEGSLDAEQAHAMALAPLQDGYSRLGNTASMKVLAELQRAIIPYSEAMLRAVGHHSDFRTGEMLEALPYYGEWLEEDVMPGSGDPADDEATRYGRVTNPTVHIGLNQLRRVVNAIIDRHGPPSQIVIELARELKANARQKEAMERRHNENRKRAEEHRRILEQYGQTDNGENRLRLRLYDELAPLEHRCPYSGTQIGQRMLFTSQVEVDHILPFSKTLDNRFDNRILVVSDWNRQKGNRTPYEAFGSTSHWEEIASRAEKLSPGKRKRFQPDAMEWFLKDEADFLARHLVDTQYLSKLSKRYLGAVCNPDRVYAIPGGLTALIRGKWRFDRLLGGDNAKNRNDHRHHALDAAIVGLVDRGLLNAISRASGQAEARGELEAIEIPMPWHSLPEELRAGLSAIVVSHKPERGTPGDGRVGKLFNETAYGLAGPGDKRGIPLVAHRIPLETVKPEMFDDSKPPYLADAHLRGLLAEATAGASSQKEFLEALSRFRETDSPYRHIRRARLIERLGVIPVLDRKGRPYKAYSSAGNYSYTLWRLPDGRWISEILPLYKVATNANSSTIRSDYPTAKKIMTLQQRDLIAVQGAEGRRIMRVVKFTLNGQITLVDHHEAGNLDARVKDPDDPLKTWGPMPSTLQHLKARKLRVTPDGRVFDPGALE